VSELCYVILVLCCVVLCCVMLCWEVGGRRSEEEEWR
jgi:hypothetical protein